MKAGDVPGMLIKCGRCGLAKWWHSAGTAQRCPANAGRMDWIEGSSFVHTGEPMTAEECNLQHHLTESV